MRLRVGLIGFLALLLVLSSAWDIRKADVIAQVGVSTWVAAALGFLFLGVFISITSREREAGAP